MNNPIVPNAVLYDEKTLKALKSAIEEGAANLMKMQGIKDDQKFLIDSNADALKIPKGILRELITTHHKQTFMEKVAKNGVIETIYTNVFGVAAASPDAD